MQTVTFVKFAGQANYRTWSFAMKMLTELDLYDCIEAEYKAIYIDANKKDAKARTKIVLLCQEIIYPLVM